MDWEFGISRYKLVYIGSHNGKEYKKEDIYIYIYVYIYKTKLGVPVMAQWVTNPTRNREVVDLIPGLAQWVKYLALL